ncbi:maleylpyruvate isomerase family mycothiol-dependent enzyme [Nocardioides albidus]|uniref:maleylpyruvate isomerase family mycothiol-dependent enzyme n=1 Tax=Nocardioides albidus TaxID=1517589 RepID=UPI00130511B3|nr:maleylpyruvate isomerase family mycothiol-dependent enzyme [Nocardioides albidus]
MTSLTHDLTDAVASATDRLLGTVRALSDEDGTAPSLCEGWTRCHVVAHLALNAEALAGVLRGLRDGRPTTMYASAGGRDADIDALATEALSVVRERLATASRSLGEVLGIAAGLGTDIVFERTPGGPRIPAGRIALMRLGEVEIHHADLDAGYSWADWPEATARTMLDDAVGRNDGPGVVLSATEGGRWTLGSRADAVTVAGPAAALAWWSTGRRADAVLSSSTGELPRMEGR